MKFFVVLAVVVVACNARNVAKRAAGAQSPLIWDALKVLRGGKDLSIPDILSILESAVAGKDYPVNAVIPEKVVNCDDYAQPGFYADVSEPSKCQVFHRCDNNKMATSYLCPNQTVSSLL